MTCSSGRASTRRPTRLLASWTDNSMTRRAPKLTTCWRWRTARGVKRQRMKRTRSLRADFRAATASGLKRKDCTRSGAPRRVAASNATGQAIHDWSTIRTPSQRAVHASMRKIWIIRTLNSIQAVIQSLRLVIRAPKTNFNYTQFANQFKKEKKKHCHI